MKAEEFFKHMTGIRVKSEYRIGTDGCVELMDQYAKEQAVEFAKSITLIDEIVMPRQAVMLAAHFKWDELYDQFKQQMI